LVVGYWLLVARLAARAALAACRQPAGLARLARSFLLLAQEKGPKEKSLEYNIRSGSLTAIGARLSTNF
jgi:hypothetical protein